MINILLSGCNGKMGQVISKLASEKENVRIAAGLDINTSIQNPYPVYTDINKCDVKVDVIVDFLILLFYKTCWNSPLQEKYRQL